MNFSRIFLLCQAFWIFGIFLASFFNFYFSFYLLYSFLFLIFLPALLKNKAFFLPFFLFSFLFGIFWQEFFEVKEVPFCKENLCKINFLNEREIEFEGEVISPPKEGEKATQVKLKAKKLLGKKQVFLSGKVLLFLPNGSKVKYGEVYKIKGKLEAPEKTSNPFWRNYLKKERILSVIFYPEIELQGESGFFVKKLIFNFKERLKKVAHFLPPPEGALLSALTLADRSRISPNLKKTLSQSGLYHIIAISGLHIFLLFEILISLFIFLGLWRKPATFLAALLLFLYLFIIDFPSSAQRAFIVGSILYLGLAFGRLSFSFPNLLLAASLILFFNPFSLRYDLGFQLSFLASLGIVTLAPKIKEKFGEPFLLKNLFSLSLSAQIFTLPLSLYYFKTLPIFGILANILVLPFLPYLLFLSFLFLILGSISSEIAYFLSFPLELPYFFLFKIAQILSFALEIEIPLTILLFLYLILGIFAVKISKRSGSNKL